MLNRTEQRQSVQYRLERARQLLRQCWEKLEVEPQNSEAWWKNAKNHEVRIELLENILDDFDNSFEV